MFHTKEQKTNLVARMIETLIEDAANNLQTQMDALNLPDEWRGTVWQGLVRRATRMIEECNETNARSVRP